jgi:magnesium-transporting ATPase (P-type)
MQLSIGPTPRLRQSCEQGDGPNLADETHARTMAFTTLMMFQLFNVYNCRSTWRSAFSGFFENKWLIAAVTLSLFTHVLVIYVPFLQAAIAKWWGPNGFTTTIHAMDVRVGGA